MGEGELAGMKKRPAAGRPLRAAVDAIASNGMTDGPQVKADLMLSAGVQFNFEKSGPKKALLHFVVRDRGSRRFVVVSRDVPLAGFVLVGDGKIDGTRGGFGNTVNERKVATQERVVSERGASSRVAFAGQSHRDQTRGASIQPVQRAHIRPGSANPTKIRPQAA